MYEDSKFVLAKIMGPGRIGIIRRCDTEKEIRELYKHLLVQSGLDSEYMPYQKIMDGYAQLLALAFEVKEELKEKMEREKKENIEKVVM